MAYPDDRFNSEKDKIADYIIVCHNENGCVKFYGIISKEKLLTEMELAKRMYSKMNQEYFRTVSLDHFSFQEMINLIERMDKI